MTLQYVFGTREHRLNLVTVIPVTLIKIKRKQWYCGKSNPFQIQVGSNGGLNSTYILC